MNDDAAGPSYEGAVDQVNLVINWYNEQLLAQRRSGAPDPARVKQLTAERQEAIDAMQALDDADAAERRRITERYEARLRDLAGE
ncbi:hypothetical protein AB0I94_36270 [Streptomyces sp. NPDC050147]|uniref:hypothetical protein n=1 Tax=Streptomyces sp. NPDC050147 TaxID=3155513 RepID=UPI003423F8F3